MFKTLTAMLAGRKPAKPDPARYAIEREAAYTGSPKERLALARNKNTHPEILYYLAEKDSDRTVREAVASNEATPLQASAVLVQDQDVDVRMALARRLVTLLPHLSEDKQSQLYAFAVQAMGTLALDEVLKIRLALSSALKDHAHAPPSVVGALARDVEREVSEPILRFCSALSDDDLLEILSKHPASWAVQAIAGRKTVSPAVTKAVIASEDVPGGTILLRNEGAVISDHLLKSIVDMARQFPEWQKPIAVRKNLPPDLAKELAHFVEPSVRDLLLKRGDFDKETCEEVTQIFKRRLTFMNADGEANEKPAAKVKRLEKMGQLNETAITDALGVRDYDFVTAAIIHISKVPKASIDNLMQVKAPKPVVALAWRSRFSMRTAFLLQRDWIKVDPKELIYPRNGTDYPLTQEELNWQLEFFGMK